MKILLLAALFALPVPAAEVSLARTWATDADIDRLLQTPDLTILDLSLTYVSDQGIEKLRKLDRLEDLNLYAAEFITDAAVSFLRANKKLRRLNLRGTDITDTSLAYLADLTGLESLDISYTQVSDVGLDHLAALANLQELNLGGNKISGAGLHVLKLLPKLRKLSFEGIQRRNAGYCWAPVVTDQELDAIALLSGLRELKVGWGLGVGKECRVVGGIRITDVGLEKLRALTDLRVLDLSGAPITTVQPLEKLSNLEQLSLWNVQSVEGVARLKSLVQLDLSNTPADDETLRALSSLPNLKRLYLTDTKATAEGVAQFRKQHPQVQVSWATRPKGDAR